MEYFKILQRCTVEELKLRDGAYFAAVKIEAKDGSQKVRLHIIEEDENKGYVEFSMSKMESQIRKIKNFGYLVEGVKIAELIMWLESEYENLPVIKAMDTLGWNEVDGKIIGYQCTELVDMDGDIGVSDIFNNEIPKAMGDGNWSTIQKWMQKHTKRQIILAWQLAAILAGLLNRNLLLSIVGKSSVGKTSAARVAESVYAGKDYGKLYKNFNGTANAVLKSMGGIRGVGVLIDDASLGKVNNMSEFLYRLAEGSDKARLGKNAEVIEQVKWATSTIMTAEESLLDKCNVEQEGVFGRVLEIEVEGNELFDSDSESREMQKYVSSNYGVLGIKFVKKLLSSGKIKEVEKRFDEKVVELTKGVVDGVLLRISELFAVVMVIIEVLEELDMLKFDKEEIRKEMMTTAEKKLCQIRSRQLEFVVENEVYPMLLEKAKKSGMEENEVVFIDTAKWKSFLKEVGEDMGISEKDIENKLKTRELLIPKKGTKEFSVNKTINGKSKRGYQLKNMREVA